MVGTRARRPHPACRVTDELTIRLDSGSGRASTVCGSGPHACKASRPTRPQRHLRTVPGRRSTRSRTTRLRRSQFANHRRDRPRLRTPPDPACRLDASSVSLRVSSTRTVTDAIVGRVRSMSPRTRHVRTTPALLTPRQLRRTGETARSTSNTSRWPWSHAGVPHPAQSESPRP